MPRNRAFTDRVVGLLLPLGPVKARAMFGGWGIYLDGVMFALVASDRLFIKVDQETKAHFSDAGSRPFTYEGKSRPVEMSYWQAPDGSLESADSLLPWAELGIAAAKRARAKKKPKSKAG